MSRLYALLLVAAAALGVACDDPCTELANTICDCEDTESRQQTCRNEVEAKAEAKPPDDAAQDRCQSILDADTCNCDALAEGQLAACGLAEE
jgi:hypothetical protein